MKQWLLEFHPDKLKHLQLNTNWEENETVYYIGQDPAKKTKSEKDLGVTVDYRLSFEDHINIKVKKANGLMGMIRRTFSFRIG